MATSAGAGSKASISTPQQTAQAPRRFAPLDPDKSNIHNAPKLKGIIFDVDGTLCLPQNHMFGEMRQALGIPKSIDILSHIRSLSTTPSDPLDMMSSPQAIASAKIRTIESHHMTQQTPQPGLRELFTYLARRNVPQALCTRNFPAPVHHLLNTFLPEEIRSAISPIITRETEGIMPKPSPEGLWKIAEAWGLHLDLDPSMVEVAVSTVMDRSGSADATSAAATAELGRRVLGTCLIMVGDSVDDMEAGYRAGAATVLLLNEHNQYLLGDRPELVNLGIKRLDDLIDVLEGGFEGSAS